MAGAETLTALALRIERVDAEAKRGAAANDARQETHERVCAERYGNIIEKMGELGDGIARLAGRFEGERDKSSATAWGLNWKAWCFIAAVFVMALGAVAWLSGQLYALEPLRGQAEVAHGAR